MEFSGLVTMAGWLANAASQPQRGFVPDRSMWAANFAVLATPRSNGSAADGAIRAIIFMFV